MLTQGLLSKCEAEISDSVLIEFLGVKPELVDWAKKAYPARAAEMTRYELLGSLGNKEVYELIFNKLSRYRSKPVDYSTLL